MYITHRMEQYSMAYVRALAARAGVNISKPEVDNDSIDVSFTFKGVIGNGSRRSPILDAQLKCTSNPLVLQDKGYSFSLNRKNYDDLRLEHHTSRILIVMEVPENIENWLAVSEESIIMKKCGYWMSLKGLPEVTSDNKTVYLPKENLFDHNALFSLLEKIGSGEDI